MALLHDEEAELRAAIAESGRTTKGQRGELIEHPLVKQLRAVETAIARLKQALGLGPLARARLRITVAKAVKETNTAERLMEKWGTLLKEGDGR